MKKIRIGNDFRFVWVIERNSQAEDLTLATNLVLTIKSMYGDSAIPFTLVDGNKVCVDVDSKNAGNVAKYNLRLTYTIPDDSLSDGFRDCSVDIDAFEIVAKTELAEKVDEFTSTSEIAIGFEGADAFEVWVKNGNEGKTYEDYIAFLQKPATLAAAAADLAKEVANSSATLANDKAVLAQSAATLANTKAGLANDAAVLATDKAALADSKATLANEKADLAQSAADNANTKATEFTAEEGLRVTAETGRVTAETGRATAETGRTTAEGLRVTAETTRGANETGRQTAETARIGAESSRATAETGRTTAETARVTAENARNVASNAYNLTVSVPLSAGQYYTATTARAAIPANVRKLGLKITYATSAGVWVEEQFIGSNVNNWNDAWASENKSLNRYFSVNMLSVNPTSFGTFETKTIPLLEPLEIGREYILRLKLTSSLNNDNSTLFSLQFTTPGYTQLWSNKEVFLFKQYEEIFTANTAYENLQIYCGNYGGNVEVECYKSIDTRTIDDNITSLNTEVEALNTELEALNTELEALNTEVEATLADSYSEEERLVNAPTSVATFSNNNVLFDRDVEIGERIRVSILLTSHLNNGTQTSFTIQAYYGGTYIQNIVTDQTVILNVPFQIDYTNNSSKISKLNFYCSNFGGGVELSTTTELITPGKLAQLENRVSESYPNYSAIISSGEKNNNKLYIDLETGKVYRYDNGFKPIITENLPILIGKKILWFGTSIPTGINTIVNVGNYSGENKYPSMVAFETGATVYNESLGGTRISTGIPSAYNEINDPMGIGNNIQGSFGFYSALTHTIAEKDWIYDNWATIYTKFQDAGSLNATCPKTKEQLRDYSFERKLISKYLKSTATVSNVNLYVINHDFNDMFKIEVSGGDTIPSANSATERMYYAGAVNFIIRKIYSADAKARIVMVSHYRKGESALDKMYNLVKQVANNWSIPFIDLANNLQTAQQIQTSGYTDVSGIWHDTGYTFVNNGDGTFTTNDYGPQRNWDLTTYLTYALPHQVVSSEDISFVYPVGTWVRTEHRLNILCPDNVHPHSDLTGKANMMIAKIIIKEIEKYII